MQQRVWFRIVSNRFVMMTAAFVVWMTFIDIHSCQVHREIDREMADIENSIDYYRHEITRDEDMLMQLQSQSDMLEKFAREQYLLRKENEEVYLVEE